jgi:hypothetical protein
MIERDEPDPWLFWKRAIQAPGLIGTYELPLFVDAPEIGFYRLFDKRLDRWAPVAFFFDDAALLCCQVDGRLVEPLKMGDIWHRCCRHPISYAAYQDAIAGNGFADEPPAPALGHNLSTDLREQLLLEFEAEQEIARDLMAKDLSQDIADQIAIMTKRLSGLRQRADLEHTKEKRPHLEAGREVDDRWRFRDGVTETVTLLKKHLQPWLDSHEPSAGRTGAKVSLRRVYVGEIVNAELFFGAVKDRPEVREALQKVANQLARAHAETPGLVIREEARAI